ncbi:MAG: ABC transporter ATP-binding protein [Caulobacterales bacterium]|nr:ABC transporter ATP-binding protein [Caulobacterales bacterium]
MGDEADSRDELVVEARDLVFGWKRERVTLAIDHFHVAAGERVFLRGPSGSGKSTLLGLICGVLTPDQGTMRVLGEDLGSLSGARRDALRAAHLGVIFQMFNLLPYMSVIGNVTLPCRFSARRRRNAIAEGGGVEAEARRLVSRLGLADEGLLAGSVRELSVGQQQRVAAARALIGGPEIVIADEPTSALDADARDAFLTLLIEECAARGSSLVFVSHDAALSEPFDRAVNLAELNSAASAGMAA